MAVSDKTIDQIIDEKLQASEKRSKEYTDKVFGQKPPVDPPVDPKPDPEPEPGLKKCKEGPEPRRITDISTTGAMLLWHGDDVHGFDYRVFKGTEKVAEGKIAPTSNFERVTWPELAPGDYSLQLEGNTCKSDPLSIDFSIPKPIGGGPIMPPPVQPPPVAIKRTRQFIMNMTGYGWDASSSSGMDDKWVERLERFLDMEYQGNRFKGVQGVQVNIKWYEYEPEEGKFRDDVILKMVKYCRKKGISLNFCIQPWRRENFESTKVIPNSDKAVLVDGKRWYEEGQRAEDNITPDRTYIPSMNSIVGRAKFRSCVRHLSAFMKDHADVAGYIYTANSHTEEFQMMRNENPLRMTGYSDADFEQWRIYSGGKTVPRPADYNVQWTIDQMFQSSEGKQWYEFQTKALRDWHAEFARGVREGGGLLVCGMFAGAGPDSSTYNYTHNLAAIFSAGTSDQPDIIYSSEGDAGSQSRKWMSTDMILGTFPGAKAAAEVDTDDVSVAQTSPPPQNADLSPDILYYYAESFFRRGGTDFHFAMAWTPSKINQFAPALYRLNQDFVLSDSGMKGIKEGSPIRQSITSYTGGQPYHWQWFENGGSADKQIKIILNP